MPDRTRKPPSRTFKTKEFAKLARKAGVEDRDLCKAAQDLEEGKGGDLGGNVWKKRVNQNRSRAIVVTKPGDFWLFTYLFDKADRDNIEEDELLAFRKAAADLGMGGLSGMERLAQAGVVVEICNDCEDEKKQGGAPDGKGTRALHSRCQERARRRRSQGTPRA